MTLIEFKTYYQQSMSLAKNVAEDIEKLLLEKEVVNVCLPGGITPVLFFKFLRQMLLDWKRVRIFLNDERWVPLDNSLSNQAMLQANFKLNLAASVDVVPFYQETLPIDKAVEKFNQKIDSLMPLDICVLGMGDDGHTASLFPSMPGLSSALDDKAAPALIIANVPEKEEQRVSLNLSAY